MILTETKEANRRVYERVRLAEPVRIQFADPKLFFGGLSVNISEGGFQMYSHEFAPMGTEFTASVVLEDASVVECMVRVVWIEQVAFSDRFRIGLKFIDSQGLAISRSRISRFVGTQKEQQKALA